MGFIQLVKNKLGIGGVKVQLELVSGQTDALKGAIDGKFIISSKSDQEIKSATVRIFEEFTTGRGENKKTKEYELGKVSVKVVEKIIKGAQKEYDFVVPFVILKSDADELKEKGGALGTIGKLSKFAGNEKSEYFVEVDIDVKGAVIDPSDKKAIKLH